MIHSRQIKSRTNYSEPSHKSSVTFNRADSSHNKLSMSNFASNNVSSFCAM